MAVLTSISFLFFFKKWRNINSLTCTIFKLIKSIIDKKETQIIYHLKKYWLKSSNHLKFFVSTTLWFLQHNHEMLIETSYGNKVSYKKKTSYTLNYQRIKKQPIKFGKGGKVKQIQRVSEFETTLTCLQKIIQNRKTDPTSNWNNA